MTIPLTPAPKGEATLEVEVDNGPRRAGLRQQQGQLHRQLRIGRRDADRLPRARPGPSPRTPSARPPGGIEFEPLRTATIHDAILAVERGEAERALVPFENSIEGSVRSTLDTLAFEAEAVTIVGEHDFAVRAHLIARKEMELGADRGRALSPPAARTVRPLPARAACPRSERRSVSSTAAAVRMVGESDRPWAAIGAHSAAELYGCVILREGIEDEADNVTRFVWIAPDGNRASSEPALGRRPWSSPSWAKTTPEPSSRRCSEFSSRGSQPEQDRVAAAAPGPRPLHVLLRPGGLNQRRRGCRSDRSSPAKSGVRAPPGLLSGCLTPVQSASPWHGSWFSMLRMSRSTFAR